MAAKFLFCLPLRLGVLLFTLFQFLVCGGAAGLIWWLLYILRTDQQGKDSWDAMPQYLRITLIVVGAIYTIASLVGLLGFLGAIFKKNGFVKTYFTLLCTIFVFQIASSVWYLVSFYKARGESGDNCLGNNTTPERVAYCNALEQLKQVPQGWAIAGAVVPVVIMAYCVYVVYHYIKRLNKQKLEKELRYHKSTPSYTPGKGGNKEETYPLTQPAVTYPYTDSVNAFGANKTSGAPGPAFAPVASQRV